MSRFIGWKEEYAMGVPGMDAQHRKIFEWLKRMEEASTADRSVSGLLEEGKRHSTYHFGCEENFLREIDFPGLVQQRVQHQRFLARLEALEESTARQEDRVTLEQVHELQSWLMGHILGLDREYAEFLEQRKSST